MPIRLLPPEVASQIAAGEVVERPASVVKELLENALDAGARQVTIRIEGAGQRLVEISDDGCGIPASELLLAVERHATSKLQRAEDLFSIGSLGFRGEALASIGSVSRMGITSRAAGSALGGRVTIEGGAASPVEAVGAPVGTQVRVSDLFYNVPARLKFLKTDATERRQIDTLVTHYALAYPNVRFQLTQEGRPALQTSGNGERREVLAALYGIEIARQMIEVLSREDGVGVTGYISPTSHTRSNRREMIFFVNGRPVQDPALTSAVMQGYHTLLMVGRFPVTALFIELPPDAVDVNVHPAKSEVRFRSSDQVFGAVQRAVRRALMAHTPIPDVSDQLQWAAPPEAESPPWEAPALRGEVNSTWGMAATSGAAASPQNSPIDPPSLPGISAALLRLVGQVAGTYLIAEGPDGLYLIDQHAAHERVLFEKLMTLHTRGMPAQALLAPAAVELPPSAARLLNEQLGMLQHLGFDVEAFGRNTFLVRAVPQLLSRLDPAAALRVLVEDFEEDETPLQAETEARIVARVCKRAAVKAGQVLSPEEQRALLADLQACASPRTCPHGRPTMIHLSVDLLERQFGRRGAR
jgi:DNA mismatch repair protein MutL